MATSVHAGDVLAGRYRMVDLLVEDDGAWLWNAHDRLLHRPVALHLLDAGDERTEAMVRAARVAARISDRRNLRVLDCNRTDTHCYVVNEWGQGTSLDIALPAHGPLPPVRAAWLVHEVADILVNTHAAGAAHGRLLPENVLIDENGEVRVIGSGVEAALRGLPFDDQDADVHALVSLLYATLTGRWPGVLPSAIPSAPRSTGRVLRPRQVRAGIPRPLDVICDEVLNGVQAPPSPGQGSGHGSGGLGAGISNGLSNGLGAVLGQRESRPLTTAEDVRDALQEFLGEHEPELPTATALAPPPEGLAPVHRPWQPPRDEATSLKVSRAPSTPSGIPSGQHSFTAHRTSIYRSLSFNNSCSQTTTTSITTTSTVIARQRLSNSLYSLINLYLEFFTSYAKEYSHQQSYYCNTNCCHNNIYHTFIPLISNH